MKTLFSFFDRPSESVRSLTNRLGGWLEQYVVGDQHQAYAFVWVQSLRNSIANETH